jgi:hypothetical protein
MGRNDRGILLLEKPLLPANLPFTHEALSAREKQAFEALKIVLPLHEKLRCTEVQSTFAVRDRGIVLQLWLTADAQQLLPFHAAGDRGVDRASAAAALQADATRAFELLQGTNLRLESCARTLRLRRRQRRIEPRPDSALLEQLIEREARRERQAWELNASDGPLQLVFPQFGLSWQEEVPRNLLGRVSQVSERYLCLSQIHELNPAREALAWPLQRHNLKVLFDEKRPSISATLLEEMRCGHWIRCSVLLQRGTRTGQICGATLAGEVTDYGARPATERDNGSTPRLRERSPLDLWLKKSGAAP